MNNFTQNGACGAIVSAHIYTVADVAAKLNLKLQPNGKYCGAVEGTGTTKDGFILRPEGTAFTNGGETFTSKEVAELAGITPEQYAPYVQYTAFNKSSATSYPTKAKTAPKATKSPTNAPFDWALAQTFDYTNEAGELLYQVGRIGDGTAKRISQRRPDGNGGYVYGLGAGFYNPATHDGKPAWYLGKPNEQPKKGAREFPDVQRVLYQLSDVLRAQTVFICEGEKAVASLNTQLKSAGVFGEIVATTNPHGGGKWKDEFAVELAGKTVCVLPDNDEPGLKHGDEVCRSCARAGAVVKRVELPDLPTKGDVADYLGSGGTVENIVALMGAAPTWTPAAAPRNFPRLKLSEVFARPRLEYLVQGIFVETGTGVISADYGGFKSFIALDMGLCIATGRAWMNRATKRGSVVYVTPEGAYTVADRVKAWMLHHNISQLPENFEIIELPVQIGDARQCALLIDELREFDPAFIILDTVAKCNVGRDENDAAAMGEFTNGMEKVSRELGAFVLAIHHNNKNGTARGSVSLPANVDASITLRRAPNRIVTIGCDRVKGAPFEPFSLVGRIVETGEADECGTPISSLVFEPTDTPTGAVPQSDQTRERIFKALETAGSKGLTASDWQNKAGVGRSTLAEHRAALVEENRVEWDGKNYKVAKVSAMSAMSGADITDTEIMSAMSGGVYTPDVPDVPDKQSGKPKRRAKNSPDAEPYKSDTPGNVGGAI